MTIGMIGSSEIKASLALLVNSTIVMPTVSRAHTDQLDQSAAGEVLDGAHVFDRAADQLSALGMVVEGKRQVLDVVEELIAQVVRDVLGHVVDLVALNERTQRFSQPQAKDD